MGDFALVMDGGCADLVIRDDDLATDEGLRTAVSVSLFTDRRAEDDDDVPGADDDRRGWWGDEFAEADGDRIGSRLWLLERAKRSPNLAQRAEEIVREALAWLLEDRAVERIDVTADVAGGRLGVEIAIHRPAGDAVTFRFPHVWDGEALALEAT